MNSRNGAPDADLSFRPGQGDDGSPGAAAGSDGGQLTRSVRIQRPLQDIQDIIDKLAAVTQELHHLGGSRPRSPR